MKKSLKTLWKRFNSDVPKFWKKVQIYAGTIAVSALAVWTLNQSLELQMPSLLVDICKYTMIIAAVITGQSQFTIKDKDETV